MLIQRLRNYKFSTNLNGSLVWLFFLTTFLGSGLLYAQKQKYTVVLDAGHGGHDPGNVGNGYREKIIALKVVKAVGEQLKNRKDIKVVYTREGDVFVDLWKRGEIANKVKADLFVSIHCNSHTSSVSGTESFVLGLNSSGKNLEVAKKENAVILLEDNYKERYKGFDPNSPESVIGLSIMQEENLDKSLALAASVQQNFTQNLKRRSRGVKQAGFVVLYQTYMPSILVELGFLTNKNEGKYLNSKKGQQEMAGAITKAIEKYFDQIKINTVVVDDVVAIDNKESIQEKKIQEKEDVLFKIQIASSKKRIKTKSYNFKGLKNVERVKVGNYFKYYYGVTSDYDGVKKSLEKAKKKGYTSAFIVAFKNGKKISLKEAFK